MSCRIEAGRGHRSRARATSARLGLAGLLIAAAPLAAHAASVGSLNRVSGPSPFANCTADHVGNQAGTNYPQSEIEPWIDANPRDAANLIAGWQQDRWSNGGSRGLVSGFTRDGGMTWHEAPVPKVTVCSGGSYVRASDPWVTISPNGTAYFMSLVFDNDLSNGALGRNGMLVNRSTDGGRTWGDPIALIRDPAGQILNDKNSITADDTDPKFVYAVWDRLRDFTLPPSGGSAAAATQPADATRASAGDGVVAARERMRRLRAAAAAGTRPDAAQVYFEGPSYFARTTNGGRTWEPAKKIYDPGGNSQTIANQIVVPPSGAVIDFFTEISPNGGARIGLIKSFDKGATFRAPRYAAAIATVNGIVTPDTQALVRDASILFDVAVDHRNGNLYLVWQDVRFKGVDQVAFSMSRDGGTHWSPPVRINKTPHNRNELREQAFIPSIEVGNDGKLVVTYYDFRFDQSDGRESVDHWAVMCDPGALDCGKPENWGVEFRLTANSFDISKAPDAGGYFLGDYMGLVATANRVVPAFGIVDGNQRTSIYSRPIRLGSTGALSAASAE